MRLTIGKNKSLEGVWRFVTKERVELLIFFIALASLGYGIFGRSGIAASPVTEPETASTINSTEPQPSAAKDFSKFSHGVPMHQRMPCLLCHKRTDGTTTPKFSSHLPCAGCHVQQFADSSSGICTICHTTAGQPNLRAFPTLKSFDTKFDHAKHARQNCATCHQLTRSGATLSAPSGLSAHNTCFRCHGPQTEIAGRNIGSCDTCHVSGRPQRNSVWARPYGVNFSHAKHLAGRGLSCASCHNAASARMSIPQASEHFASAGSSCASCHNNKRAFGPEDFGNCRRCHTGSSFKFN